MSGERNLMNDNLVQAQAYADILQDEMDEGNTKILATLITAYSTLAIAEKMYEEKDAPGISEDGCRKVMAFLTGNVPSDGFKDGWFEDMVAAKEIEEDNKEAKKLWLGNLWPGEE